MWEDVYDISPVNYGPPGGEFDGADFDADRAQTESLKDHLHWQMSMMRSSDTDRVIGAAIIDAVDDDGYLMLTIEDIRQSLDRNLDLRSQEVTLQEVEAVLRQIQNFDPPGVAARDPANASPSNCASSPPIPNGARPRSPWWTDISRCSRRGVTRNSCRRSASGETSFNA